MLMEISSLITPEVYEVIYRMGHLDELVIADANYYASANSKRVIYSSVKRNDEMLSVLLKYFPLDEDEDFSINVMTPDHGFDHIPEVWNDYERILNVVYPVNTIHLNKISRQEFYDRTKRAYATIQTSDPRLYADIILRKGFVVE